MRALIAWAFVAAATFAHAQEYPTRPLRVIVPLPAGSTTDIVMRATAQELSPRLKQPVVVENRPGGNWVVGAEACKSALPDGHTVCVMNSDAIAFNAHILSALPYDPAKDFAPVTNLFFLFEGILASAPAPFSSIDELRDYAAKNPGRVNFGTLGPGSSNDVFRQWLVQHWKVDIAGIPYKGGAPVITALLAGEIDVTKIGMGNIAGQLNSGKVKVLAIQGTQRSKLVPNVPTLQEAGLGGFPLRVWWGLFMPAGSPDGALKRINAELARLYHEPKMAEYLESQFVEVAVGSPEQFVAFTHAERERAAQVVKDFHIPRQ
jgi:tripartite-type tricarboxylate transporter receptor subunit TctC